MRVPKLNLLHKVLFVLGVGIVVPAVFLAYVVFRQTLAQPESERARLKASYRDVVETKAALFEAGLETLVRKVAESVRGENVDELIRSLNGLESQGVVDRSFLIEDGSGILYPDVSLTQVEKPDGVTPFLPGLFGSRAVRRAEQAETKTDSLHLAASLYERALGSASSSALKAELHHRLALVFARLGEYDDAAAHARTAAELFKASQGRSWKWVIATYNSCRWATESEQRRAAAFPLVSLYADIVRAKEPFGLGERTALVREKVLAGLEDLRANPPSPDPAEQALAYVDVIKEEESEAAGTRRLLSSLDLLLLPALSLAGSQPAPGEVEVIHGVVQGETVEVAFWTVPYVRDRNLLAGFSVNLPVIAATIESRLNPMGGTDNQPLVSLVDAGGRLLAGPPIPSDAPPLATVKMTESFPGWEMKARERNPGQIERDAHKYLTLYLALLILVGVAISLSVWFTARSLAREVELGKLKSEFVSSVSHELKTPLSLIQLHNDTLFMNKIADPSKRAQYHEVIGRECTRLSRLIDRVLDFSRTEIGRKKYDLQREDLASLVESAVEICGPEAEVKGISIDARGLSRRVPVQADADALAQALENIIDNAVKYSPPGSRIEVALRTENNYASVSVADSGIGIDVTEQKKIFEEFYRVARPEVRSVRGSGLGLALVQHTVRAHGGSVNVSSTAGKGSTFTVTIPLAKEE